MFAYSALPKKPSVLIGSPQGQPYKCSQCDVWGYGTRCWFCGSEDVKRYQGPFLTNGAPGVSIRDEAR